MLFRSASSLAGYLTRFEQFLMLDERAPNPYMIVFGALKRNPRGVDLRVRFEDLGLVNPEVLVKFLGVLRKQLRKEQPTEEDVRKTFEGFHELLHCFNNFQLLAIYQNDAGRLRAVLNEQARSNLNAARERYVHFIHDYDEFLDALNRRLHGKIMPFLSDAPKPL